MSKPNPKKLILVPMILLLIWAVIAFMNGEGSEPVEDPGMVPEPAVASSQPDPEPTEAEIHSPEVEVRKPDVAVHTPAAPIEEPIVEPIAVPESGLRILSRHLQVPLSFAFIGSADQPDDAIEVGDNGLLQMPEGRLLRPSALWDIERKNLLVENESLELLPQRNAKFSNLCTLLLDAPAGPLPSKRDFHAALLSKSGRVKPVPIRSIESRPGGWTIRVEEPEEFIGEISLDRVLICIDPPIKDHVRVASWTLDELRSAKANKLRPLPTHSLPLKWKGLAEMGNLAAQQKLGSVFFTGSCQVPGFQSPSALDWLAAPPKRAFRREKSERTYDRVPEGITCCSAYFTRGSVASVKLPSSDDWKFGVELFLDEVQKKQARSDFPGLPNHSLLEALTSADVVNVDELEFAGQNWIWGAEGELLNAISYRFGAETGFKGMDGLFDGVALPDTGAMLSINVVTEDELLSTRWSPIPQVAADPGLPHWIDPSERGRLRILNQSNWTGQAVLHLISLDSRGVSLRSIPFRWPLNSNKVFRAKADEVAWIVTSQTAKASSGLLGPNLDPLDDRKKDQLRRNYDIALQLEYGWSSLLVGELANHKEELPEKLQVHEIHRGRLRPTMRSVRAAPIAGTATAISTLSSAVVETELGPWGLKMLSSDAAPSFLDLGFPNGPLRQIQPHERTSIFVLKLAKD